MKGAQAGGIEEGGMEEGGREEWDGVMERVMNLGRTRDKITTLQSIKLNGVLVVIKLQRFVFTLSSTYYVTLFVAGYISPNHSVFPSDTLVYSSSRSNRIQSPQCLCLVTRL